MAQQAALLTSGRQLSSINETLKKQGSSEKLKRTPSVQERVRTNDSMAMILAKVYAITKKEQEINKAYRKEQIETTKNFNESFIVTLKSTSDNIKKAIEKSVKVNEKLLEENKTIREEQKLFEEEKNEEAKALEERRHKELLEALKGKKEPEGKKEKENWLTKLLGPVLSKLLTKLGKTIFNMLPGGAQLLLRGLGQLGRIFVYAVETILPRVISAALANPLTSLALAITGLSLKIGSDYKEMEDKLKKAADAGDIETLKKESQFYVDRINEQGGNISVDEFAKSRLQASKTPQAKEALQKFRGQKSDGTENMSEDNLASKYMSEKGYMQQGGAMGTKKVWKDIKTGKEATPELLNEARDYAKKKIEERNVAPQKSSENMSFKDVVNQNFAIIKEREGFKRTTYQSAELGTDSVGIGHKLTPEEARQGGVFIKGQLVKVDRNTPLTDQQVLDLYYQDINKHMMEARRKIGADVFDKLPGNKQYALAELNFAGGENTLPTGGALVKAVRAGNMEEAERQIRGTARYYTKPVVDKEGKAVIDQTTGKQKMERIDNPRMAAHAEKRADMFARGPSGAGGDTMVAQANTNEELDKLFKGFQQSGGENPLGETATPEKKSIFGLIANELKSELEMLQGFTKGEGAKELQDVLETTKSMFAEIAPSSISPALSALTNVQKMNASLSGQAGSTNITTINQQQLAQGGGGGHTASIPGNIYDINNPSVQAALYGMHNVRPSYG